MTYPAIAVANFFVQKSLDSGDELTPMKLIKLVYIAHGWYLAITKEPLLSEAVEAWKYGPVVPSVYKAFKKYGSNQITKQEETFVNDEIIIQNIPQSSESDCMILNHVWMLYKKYDGIYLGALTHKDGTPWHCVVKKNRWRYQGELIPNELIKQHYDDLLAEMRKKAA